MAYITTPDLGLELADPMTIQAFETTNVNSNFLLLEAGIVADRVRLTSTEARATALEAGAGRGDRARSVATNPTALSAISNALLGDRVRVTTPGTGISAFWAECIGGSGTGADWTPVTDIIAATKANFDTFAAAWVADLDFTFGVGQQLYLLDSGTQFVYTGSVWKAAAPGFLSVAASTANNTSGAVSSGSMVTIPTIPCSASVALPVAQRAKVTIRFEFKATAVGSGIAIGAILTGATTFTPAADTVFAPSVTSQNASAEWAPYTVVIDYSLNAGTTAVTVGAQIIGPGSTRSIRHIQLFVEPLFV